MGLYSGICWKYEVNRMRKVRILFSIPEKELSKEQRKKKQEVIMGWLLSESLEKSKERVSRYVE